MLRQQRVPLRQAVLVVGRQDGQQLPRVLRTLLLHHEAAARAAEERRTATLAALGVARHGLEAHRLGQGRPEGLLRHAKGLGPQRRKGLVLRRRHAAQRRVEPHGVPRRAVEVRLQRGERQRRQRVARVLQHLEQQLARGVLQGPQAPLPGQEAQRHAEGHAKPAP
eukprot:scaffold336_cov250-Pinguiococcus_pyrenoidosus.AAC.8